LRCNHSLKEPCSDLVISLREGRSNFFSLKVLQSVSSIENNNDVF